MAWLYKYLPKWSFAKMSPLASIHMYIKFEYALMYVCTHSVCTATKVNELEVAIWYILMIL